MQTLEDDDAVIELLEDNGGTSGSIDNGQLVTKRMIKEERFCNTFGLSLTEKIIKSFPCFLVAEILIQGTMVVTQRHICFYSNIPGLRRNIKIRFSDVNRLTKEKVYAFFPTGIGVHSHEEKVIFSYVTSRDKLLQLLRTQWESCSEVDEDFCSSAQGSSVDEAPMDCQASSRDVSVLNDEDSGILVAPTVSAASAANSLSDASRAEDEHLAEPSGEFATNRAIATDIRPESGWRSIWKVLTLHDWDTVPNRHAISFIAALVLLCAVVIVYLSYRLSSLQQQLLQLVSVRSDQGQSSDLESLNHKLGGIVETLSGLQVKLGNLKTLLHTLHATDNQ